MAFVVFDNTTSKNLEKNLENPQNKPSSKKANIAKTIAAAALITIAGAVNGQNAATIDPIHYKTAATPFVIPNLPSGSDYYLSIKGGEPIYITIDGIDINSGNFHLGTGTGRDVN
ncbi:MAG: hypothetical protein WCK78_15710 [Paludibacter sp.]